MSNVPIDRKLCKLAHPTSFLSTATKISCTFSGTPSVDYSRDKSFQLSECVWRPPDVDTFFRNRDTSSIMLLEKFGFFGRRDLPGETYTPLIHRWDFDPGDLDSETCGRAAGKLYRESLNKVKRIGFVSMIQQALGLSAPELISAIWEYKWLHRSLCGYIMGKMEKAALLLKVEEELKLIGADPFIIFVFKYAHECVQECEFGELDLEPTLSHFITGPLQIHLNKPTSAILILQQLEVVKLRFDRYVNGDWRTPLNTYTGHIEDFQRLGPYGFAESLTQTEHVLYMKLSINAFKNCERTAEDTQTLKDLHIHSNDIVFLVSDSLKCHILNEDQWLRCAMKLFYLRNFFGFYAVKTGLTANGNSKSTIKQFDSLLNGTQGLNRADPCLLPIFHATMDAERRGCSDLGDEAINLRASYSPEYITCSEEYGRTEDNIVQQSVQCNRLLRGFRIRRSLLFHLFVMMKI